MIGDLLTTIFMSILSALPVLAIPSGFDKALDFLKNVIGFVNIFIPVLSIMPIIFLIISIRNFNVILAGVSWILRLTPFGK